jgi:hypothetical protein
LDTQTLLQMEERAQEMDPAPGKEEEEEKKGGNLA